MLLLAVEMRERSDALRIYKSNKYELESLRVWRDEFVFIIFLECKRKITKHIINNRAKTEENTEVSAINSKNFDFVRSLCYTDDALKEG